MQPIAILDRNPLVNDCAVALVEAITEIMQSDSADAREVAGFVALAKVRELAWIKEREEKVCKTLAA
jgi:hypothetical protein